MRIRKQYSIEMGHLVRNCSSERCAFSQHGHSAIIEVILSASALDNAGMVYDFGLMKGTIKQFIDSFDHCYVFWSKESNEFKDYIKKFNHRWIEVDFNPTAENLALFFHGWLEYILSKTNMYNNESPDIHVASVIYHETATGYAQTEYDDVNMIFNDNYDHIEPRLKIFKLSEHVTKDWSNDLKLIMHHRNMDSGKVVDNPAPFHQIEN